ncbi:MAG: amidase, partial [Pseudomonadota bacterium]
MAELHSFSIQQASKQIASGELKPSELMESCIARIKAVDDDVRAWAHFDPDSALMHARLADTRPLDHPLFGIPFGVKDIIEAIGLPTTYGTPIHHVHHSIRDAACVALLKEAGAIVAGKVVTTELAHFHPGKTRNPHSGTHTPGGSSSGSAAAVAAGMVPFALGTQTTGSVLRPASYCGVFGFKPSFGDVNRSGVFECVSSFDTVGWFTRSIDDVETVRQGVVRLPPQSLDAFETKKLRIGLFRGSEWEKAAGATRNAIEQAAATLVKAGAGVSDVTTPDWFRDLAELHRRVAGFEFARAITYERTEHAHLLSRKLVDGRCGDGLELSYEDYVSAQDALLRSRLAFADLMQDYDVIMTPSAPGEAWDGLAATGDPVFNTAWTALHVPAISIPAFKGPSDLPVGLQLVGCHRQDA